MTDRTLGTCPACGNTKCKATETEDVPGGVRRRRACDACGATFRTTGRVIPDGPTGSSPKL